MYALALPRLAKAPKAVKTLTLMSMAKWGELIWIARSSLAVYDYLDRQEQPSSIRLSK